jgi:preprotein translocase subunit SecA
MNKQRQEIYSFRSELLHCDDPILLAKEIIFNVCSLMAETYLIDPSSDDLWKIEEYKKALMMHFPVTFDSQDFVNNKDISEIEEKATEKINQAFDEKLKYQKDLIAQVNTEEKATKILKEVVRSLLVRKIDDLWQAHLLSIDHLRSDVSLRSIGQKDPLVEFKHEAFHSFELFSKKLKMDVSADLFRFEMISPEQKKLQDTIKDLQLHTNQSFIPQPQTTQNSSERPQEAPIKAPIEVGPKIGRNDYCPCNSGKKFKKCCGKES